MSYNIRSFLNHAHAVESSAPRQLPALFRPAVGPTVLTSPQDTPHVTRDHLVGSLQHKMQAIEEEMINRLRADHAAYMDLLADRYADDGRRDTAYQPTDPVLEPGPRGSEMVAAPARTRAPVKVYAMEDGTTVECWGDQYQGFELRRGAKLLPSRFRSMSDADIAVQLYQKRRNRTQMDQDYIEER
jgi:hypothetical protein